MLRELTPADNERIINRITDEAMKRDLETVAIMLLTSIKPISFIGSQMAMLLVAPFLSIFGDLGIDYIKFFEKRENVDKLLERLEEAIRIKDEDKEKAKEQKKQIHDTFGFRINLLPGFSIRDIAQNDASGLIGITRQGSHGSIAISLIEANSPPNEIFAEISKNLNNNIVLRQLMLAQNTTLCQTESKQHFKIKGHEASMTSHKWSNDEGEGILQSYGFWCDKTKKLFLLTMSTGTLTGDKMEKDQARTLRHQLDSIKCH